MQVTVLQRCCQFVIGFGERAGAGLTLVRMEGFLN
jgi:hypothetical protein